MTADFGDYDEVMSNDYISTLKMMPKQILGHEDKVADYHKSLK